MGRAPATDVTTVLVQGAGGGGGSNRIRSLRQSGHPYRVIGTNCLPHAVAKSTADHTELAPLASDPGYADFLRALVERERVELVIPTSDREVRAVAALAEAGALPCRTFLPPRETVETCQDKHALYRRFRDVGIPMAKSVSVEEAGSLEAAFAALGPADRYWIRPRTGSGSKGAGWVRTLDQAERFVSLWEELRGYTRADYQVAKFMEGADYAFQSIWYRGRPVVAKLVQRLAYFGGANRLSGMSSTPEIARTLRDDRAFETAFAAARAVAGEPHGVYSMDFKCDADGVPHVTEINIGRCCMITTVFDSTGRQNTVDAYVRCAFDDPPELDDPIDVDEGWLLIRELDTEPLVVHESTLPRPKGDVR